MDFKLRTQFFIAQVHVHRMSEIGMRVDVSNSYDIARQIPENRMRVAMDAAQKRAPWRGSLTSDMSRPLDSTFIKEKACFSVFPGSQCELRKPHGSAIEPHMVTTSHKNTKNIENNENNEKYCFWKI